MNENNNILRMVEALLFASSEPLDEEILKERLPQDTNVSSILEELAKKYMNNGVVLTKVAGGWTFRTAPDLAFLLEKEKTVSRSQVLLWHMNYHPDGGQLFFPLEKKPFIFPAALPGDDLKPESIVAFWCDGSKGLYIKPNIWHEGVFPVCDEQKFLDRQGKVHARISCDIGEEFGLYLSAPLTEKFAP